MGIMDGINNRELAEKIVRDWHIYMIADIGIFPLVQLLNFKYVPLHHQTFVVMGATFLSTFLMSAIESREIITEAEEAVEEFIQLEVKEVVDFINGNPPGDK